MGSTIAENKIMDELDLIKSSVDDIRLDVSLIKTYLDDSRLTPEEKADINNTLKAKKKGRLLKAEAVFD
jgi:hypothetical protein